MDGQGNLWVADGLNNRVLRFPYDRSTGQISHTADLVLGQPDFTSAGQGTSMSQMNGPHSVRVSASGEVYVANAANGRVLVFDPPLSNGMAATRLLGSGNSWPFGLEFDPSGNIWVNDEGNNQLLRYTPTGVLDRVLLRDEPCQVGSCGGSWQGDGPPFTYPLTGQSLDSAH